MVGSSSRTWLEREELHTLSVAVGVLEWQCPCAWASLLWWVTPPSVKGRGPRRRIFVSAWKKSTSFCLSGQFHRQILPWQGVEWEVLCSLAVSILALDFRLFPSLTLPGFLSGIFL